MALRLHAHREFGHRVPGEAAQQRHPLRERCELCGEEGRPLGARPAGVRRAAQRLLLDPQLAMPGWGSAGADLVERGVELRERLRLRRGEGSGVLREPVRGDRGLVRGVECGEVRLQAVGADEDRAGGGARQVLQHGDVPTGDVPDRGVRQLRECGDRVRGRWQRRRRIRVVLQRSDDPVEVECDQQRARRGDRSDVEGVRRNDGRTDIEGH